MKCEVEVEEEEEEDYPTCRPSVSGASGQRPAAAEQRTKQHSHIQFHKARLQKGNEVTSQCDSASCMMPVPCSPSRRVPILDTEWKQFKEMLSVWRWFAKERVFGLSEGSGESGESGIMRGGRGGKGGKGLMAHHAHDSSSIIRYPYCKVCNQNS